jgi:hypothetical protein
MPYAWTTIVALVVASGLALGACAQRPRPSLAERPTPTHALSEEATGIDRSVEAQVQRRLASDATLAARDLRVAATETGVVTLYGTVRSENERHRAASLASAVVGVKRIDNEITIRGPHADFLQGVD